MYWLKPVLFRYKTSKETTVIPEIIEISVRGGAHVLFLLTIMYFWFDRGARRRNTEYRRLADTEDIDGVPYRFLLLCLLFVTYTILDIFNLVELASG